MRPCEALAGALIAVLLLGCTGLPKRLEPRALNPDTELRLSQGEVVIFGKILLVENGRPKFPYKLGKPVWSLQTSDGSARAVLLSTETDGSFYLVVPAGIYHVVTAEPFYYTPPICLPLRFNALEAGTAYYIGDLRIEFETTVVLGGLWGNYINSVDYVEIVDDFNSTAKSLGSKAPGASNLQVAKAPLERIPGRRPKLSQDGVCK